MDDDEIARLVFDGKELKRNSACVITENEQPIGFRRIVRRRLGKGQAAVFNRKPDLLIGDSVPPCRVQDPDRQRRSP